LPWPGGDGSIRILVNGRVGCAANDFLPTASHFARGGGREPVTPIRIRVAMETARHCVADFHARACNDGK
jgi:hypothetical protein